jgi:cytolysin (calcineurin-like family phosphatase)
MAKITKKQLKGILKECLKEILQEEGILLSETVSSRGQKGKAAAHRAYARDLISSEQQEESSTGITNPRLQEHVNGLADSLGSTGNADNEMFRNILADTALNTLQKQQDAGHSVGAASGGAVAAGDVTSLLSEGSSAGAVTQTDRSQLQELSHEGDTSRWAALAFAGNKQD